MNQLNTEFTNTLIKQDDGGLWLWFSPNGKPWVRYRANATFWSEKSLDCLELTLLVGDKEKTLFSGIVRWENNSWPTEVLIPQTFNGKNPKFCAAKHQPALRWAAFSAPKVNELLNHKKKNRRH